MVCCTPPVRKILLTDRNLEGSTMNEPPKIHNIRRSSHLLEIRQNLMINQAPSMTIDRTVR